MNSENILDDQQVDKQPIEVKKHRPLAFILELLPLTVFIVALAANIRPREIVVYSWMALTFIYIFGGWYLFKAGKYRIKDIIFVEIVAIFLFIPLPAGMLFKVMSWPGANEMIVSTNIITPFLLGITLIWYAFHRKRPLEWRLSLKLLLRIVIIMAISNLIASNLI